MLNNIGFIRELPQIKGIYPKSKTTLRANIVMLEDSKLVGQMPGHFLIVMAVLQF